MSFRLFLVYSFVLLGRPQDILTFLQPMRLTLVLTVLAVGAMIFGARRQELSATFSTTESRRYFLFYLVMILGIPFAYQRSLAFYFVIDDYLGNMLFFIMVLYQVNSLQRLKQFVWIICLSVATYSVFGGVLQASGIGRFTIVGNMFDPNDTAFLLVSLFPICLYFARFGEGFLKGVVGVAAIVGSVAIILQTGSRGGILGLGTVLLILLLTKTGGIGKSYKLLIVAMVISTGLLFKDAIDVERYLTLTDLSGDYNLSSAGGRLELWKGAIGFSLANPITGVGVRGFSWAYFLLTSAAPEGSYRAMHTVHNSYLQISAEVGLIGFGLFVSLIVRTFLRLNRVSRFRGQPESREGSAIHALGGYMLLGFAGLLVSGLFLSQGYSLLFTLYFALGIVLGRLQAGTVVRIEESLGMEKGSKQCTGYRIPAKREST